MVTVVERKSKYTLIRKINKKASLLLNSAVSEFTKGIMIVDSQNELARHAKITLKPGS